MTSSSSIDPESDSFSPDLPLHRWEIFESVGPEMAIATPEDFPGYRAPWTYMNTFPKPTLRRDWEGPVWPGKSDRGFLVDMGGDYALYLREEILSDPEEWRDGQTTYIYRCTETGHEIDINDTSSWRETPRNLGRTK